MSTDSNDRYAIRSAIADDLPEIIGVCSAALGWSSPTFDRDLFRWKHETNAFGSSLILVATDTADDRIVAVRTFMRWRFRNRAGEIITAARAVDTATLPTAQGNGLFRRLTLAGLDLLEDSGCGFVFNTPNDKSLPGYLKMGWFPAGNVQFGFRARSLGSGPRIVQSRTAATKPSIETPELGRPATEGFAGVATAATSQNAELCTDHTSESLHWRYASGPVSYRIVEIDDDAAMIMRMRARGAINELVLAQILGTPKPAAITSCIRHSLELTGADLLVAPARTPSTRRIGAIGPRLALRTLHEPVTPGHFAFSPGDIELF